MECIYCYSIDATRAQNIGDAEIMLSSHFIFHTMLIVLE